MQNDIIRPIIGIENRTAQEVFDIMCDRFRHLSATVLVSEEGNNRLGGCRAARMGGEEMNMRERLARAIYQARNGHGAKPWAHQPKAHQEPYLTDADAVLDELMMPTEGMYQEGEMELGCHQIFTAMIKAAKEGK